MGKTDRIKYNSERVYAIYRVSEITASNNCKLQGVPLP